MDAFRGRELLVALARRSHHLGGPPAPLALIATCGWEDTPRVLPKSERNRHGVYVGLVPPGAFVTLAVKLAMVDAAQRHRELIRYPAAECARLR